MRTVTPELAQKGIFLGDYTKTRFTNLSDMIDDDMTSADEKKSTNYDIAQKAGTLKDNLIVGHSIKDRQFKFGYKIVKDNGKDYIKIVANSDTKITVPVCYFISSKSALIYDTSGESLLQGIKSVGFSSRGSAQLPELFEKGHAFFLNSPTIDIGGKKYEIISAQVVDNSAISTLLKAINKRSKRSYYVDGPGSEFYCRCKMFKNGEVSLKRQFKYKAETGQSLAEWEDVIKAKKNEEEKKNECKVGDVIAIDGVELTVTKVHKNFSIKDREPEAGYEFIKLDVMVENKSDRVISVSLYDFHILQSDETIVEYSGATFDIGDDEWDSGDLQPNNKLSGSIVFEVLKKDSNLKLIFKVFNDGKKAVIKLGK